MKRYRFVFNAPVKRIGGNMFDECAGTIKSVKFPSELQAIHEMSLLGCETLDKVSIDDVFVREPEDTVINVTVKGQDVQLALVVEDDVEQVEE